ncbi:MAG: PPC domain-containing protein [Myxococcota bacterium]
MTVLLALAALSFGCSVDPVNETHQGTLENGDPQHPRDSSWYDEYTFKAKEGWPITVQMTSDAFDTYLQLRREGVGDEEWLQENDDMADGNTNSQITVVAPATGTYKVWANSYEANQGGAYTLTITAQPGQ